METDIARSLHSVKFPKPVSLLVLAPHPDDFDAIGITMRFFQQNGNPIQLAVATTGASGVQDSFCAQPTLQLKSEIRELEQRDSCRFFGLPDSNLTFLRLEEDKDGRLSKNDVNLHRVNAQLKALSPKMVFLPHWNDSNLTHQRVYDIFKKLAREGGYSLVAFLNRDPKTIEMRNDIYTEFDEKEAAWKAKLLRFHRSQQQRNLDQRGYGMDERILRTDRQSARACSLEMPYAEVFELEFFGGENLEDILNGRI
ncbi:MAG: PIG-L family deacetylase [Desulfobacterales bacterium]|jgi:LmbE family N-acetylglucosaminyl deacetylase